MKRIISLILCVIMAASLGVTAFGEQEITIYVNGSIVQSELKPVIVEGNTLIPLRPVAEAMGCTVTWVAEEKGIKIESENVTVRMVIDSGVLYRTKADSSSVQVRTMTVAPQIINGATYIPMRPMVESLGGKADWNSETKTVNITYNISSTKDNYVTDSVKIFGGSHTYEGDKVNGKPDGNGIMRWDNGDVYVGQFKIGHRHGTGTYTSHTGSVYEGQWSYDDRQGIGTYTSENGDVYEGEWYKDCICGRGTMTYADGSIYEGEWDYDERDGYGKMTYADGTVEEGTWSEDKFIG